MPFVANDLFTVSIYGHVICFNNRRVFNNACYNNVIDDNDNASIYTSLIATYTKLSKHDPSLGCSLLISISFIVRKHDL